MQLGNAISLTFLEIVQEAMRKKGRKWLAVVGISLLLGFWFFLPREQRALETYRETAALFAQVADVEIQANDPVRWETLFHRLRKKMREYPSLQQRYDAPLAQILVALGKGEEAEEFCTRALSRAKKLFPQATESFSKASLWIAQGNFASALQEVEAAQRNTEEKEELQHDSLLTTYHLFRMATVDTLPKEERWEPLIAALDDNASNPCFVQFRSHEKTLVDYILSH